MVEYSLSSKPHCKKCGAALDGQLAMPGRGPQPGDISVCAYCHTVGRFDDQMSIIPLTEEETIAAYIEFPELKAYVELAKEMLESKQKDLN
jgi:hypothetical protein